MGKSARARAQAVRSTPGSRTDQTMAKLADLRDTLVAEAQARTPHTKGSSKSARKRAARRSPGSFDQVADMLYAPGATKPGSRPTLNAGSIQVSPPKGRVTRPKGISLQPFKDYMPGTPGDWTQAGASQHQPAAGPAVLKYHWSSDGVDRDSMAFERAKTVTRPGYESRRMIADSVAGAAQVWASDADSAAGVIRDEPGRVVRTTDMPDCEIRQVSKTVSVKNERGIVVQHQVEYITRDSGMTPREYATSRGLRGQASKSEVRAAEAQEKRDAHRVEVNARRINREEKKAERDRLAAVRRAERAERTEAQEFNKSAAKKLRDTARAVLAAQGVAKPTAMQVRAMIEFFEGNMQRAQYITQGDLAKVA